MIHFYVPNMTCGGCVKSITRVLLSIDPQAQIKTDLTTREIQINSTFSTSIFQQMLKEAGYPAEQKPVLGS